MKEIGPRGSLLPERSAVDAYFLYQVYISLHLQIQRKGEDINGSISLQLIGVFGKFGKRSVWQAPLPSTSADQCSYLRDVLDPLLHLLMSLNLYGKTVFTLAGYYYQFAGDATQATSTVLQTVASTTPPISMTTLNNTLVTTSTGNLATRATFLCFFIVLGKTYLYLFNTAHSI